MNKTGEASYQNLAKESEQLGYRNKLRLAQLLIQLARKEEEETYHEERVDSPAQKVVGPETVSYVADRIVKLRPGHKLWCVERNRRDVPVSRRHFRAGQRSYRQ